MNNRNHQTLMDEFYSYWQSENEKGNRINRENLFENFSPLHKVAVQLGNLNYQVENGGFRQWHDNGYSEDLEDLLELCNRGFSLGITYFKTLKELLIKFQETPEDNRETVEYRCSECSGEGIVYDEDEDGNEIEVTCEECGGSGTIEEEEEYYAEYGDLDTVYYNNENWLNAYQELLNRFDEEMTITEIKIDYKPKCKLIGTDGNIFNLAGKAREVLRKAKMPEKVQEMTDKVMKSKSYEEALSIITDYVEVY